MATFREWYADPKNREALNEKRKTLYKLDPERRAKARAYQAGYRDRVRGQRPVFQGLTREQVCAEVGITPWVFNSWRVKGFFPPPTKILGRISMTENQRNLIGLLAKFHESHGPRLSLQQRGELNNIVQVILKNWSA